MRQVGVALVVAACYAPHANPGAPCASQGSACPTPLTCIGGFCVEPGGGGGGDGSAQGDAATADVFQPLIDADLTCTCAGSAVTCASGTTPCPLGCTASPSARCDVLVPSNQVDPSMVQAVATPIVIGAVTTFDTDTGAITGGIVRGSGDGVLDGIGYAQQTSGGADMGVFVFDDLHVEAGGTIQFVGARAAVFLVGHAMTVDVGAVVDGGADGASPGPGGGGGGSFATPATGCAGGAGQTGGSANNADAGGGGGGGGAGGGSGGASNAGIDAGGTSGAACLAGDLQPLVGGGGGGGGGPGSTTTAFFGGGGGGALQVTALERIAIAGTIAMGGAGGQGGPLPASNNAAAGCGGGAGGGILLESITVTIGGSAVLAANGGGGGGGGLANTHEAGGDGAPGAASATPASGGIAGGSNSGAGGAGGAVATAAVNGGSVSGTDNGGGGGGAVGAIFLRSLGGAAVTNGALISPAAGTGTVTGH